VKGAEAIINSSHRKGIGHAPVGVWKLAAFEAANCLRPAEALDQGPRALLSMPSGGYSGVMHAALVKSAGSRSLRYRGRRSAVRQNGSPKGHCRWIMPLGMLLKAIDRSLRDRARQIPVESSPQPMKPGGHDPGQRQHRSASRGVVSGTLATIAVLLNLAKVFGPWLEGNTLVASSVTLYSLFGGLVVRQIAEEIGLPRAIGISSTGVSRFAGPAEQRSAGGPGIDLPARRRSVSAHDPGAPSSKSACTWRLGASPRRSCAPMRYFRLGRHGAVRRINDQCGRAVRCVTRFSWAQTRSASSFVQYAKAIVGQFQGG